MEELIKKMKDVLDEILRIKASLIAERSKVAAQAQKQEDVAKYQAEKQVEFEKREDAVKPIEDIVAFQKAAEELGKANDQARIALDKAQQNFEAYKKGELAKITAQREEVNKLEAMYKRELEGLKKAKEEVEKEKARIGSDIVNKLTGAVKT